MKFFRLILLVFFVFTACKSKQNLASKTSITKRMSARKVVKKHLATFLDKKTIDARLNIVFKDEKQQQKLKVKLRIDTNKVIWINVTYKGMVLLARAKITPTSVSYYEKINKTYFKGDFSLLEVLFGSEINFKQLQNILIGESFLDLKTQKHLSSVNENAHFLFPDQQNKGFDVLFWINPMHFKLDKQVLQNRNKNQELKVVYKAYASFDDVFFPKKIQISAKAENKFTHLDIDYKTVIFNKNISIPFRIPKGYKPIVF